MASKKKIWFKVFLCDFPDVPHPRGYSEVFVRELIFGSDKPAGPGPDQPTFGTTVHQGFHAQSDFWLSVAGDVTSWTRGTINNRDIPHWHGSMVKPEDATTATTHFGESWPVIVAMTLRGLGYTTSRLRTRQKVQEAILALPGGRRAERLVFLHTDVASGGVKRSFSQLSSVLGVMSDDKIVARRIPGTTRRWSTLWDPSWSGLPDFLCTPIVTADLGSDRREPDGTYTVPRPPASTLTMSPLSIIYHEFGHLAVDVTRTWAFPGVGRLPDLYGDAYGPTAEHCIMGGPAKRTHHPMPFGSLARWMAGWMEYRDLSRDYHQIRLRPFETHNDAVRITNGAPGQNHYLVIANRADLRYSSDPSRAPTGSGRGVLAYRLDVRRRLRIERGGKVVRKISDIVRRSFNNGSDMLWKPGQKIGDAPTVNPFKGARTLRNEAGELWYSLEEVEDDGSDLFAHLDLHAMHLLEDYHKARWTGEAPRKPRVPLALDSFGGPSGHIALQDRRMTVAGRGGKALYLHPPWVNNGAIRGVYKVSHLNGPLRLYAKVGMPDEAAGSNGARLSFSCGSDSYAVTLQPGDHRELCIDFRKPGRTLTVLATSNGSATRDWVYILDGWLVPAAPRVYDFIAEAGRAIWTSGRGQVAFGQHGKPVGEASLRGWYPMHNGYNYGSKVLFTHPSWDDQGWIEGVWSDVPVTAEGRILRATLGWDRNKSVTDEGVDISLAYRLSRGGWKSLLDKANFRLYPSNAARIDEKRDMMFVELDLPTATRNKTISFKARVDARGSAAQDWLAWADLAITRS